MSMDAARLLDHRSEADLKAELEPLRRRVEQLQWGALRQFQSKKQTGFSYFGKRNVAFKAL